MEGHEDDEVTTRAHIDALNAELRKGSPDLAVIAVKMDRTSVYRWKRINDQRLSVADIISEFPALRRRNFVSFQNLCCLFLMLRVVLYDELC